jgi:hypothetical protein
MSCEEPSAQVSMDSKSYETHKNKMATWMVLCGATFNTLEIPKYGSLDLLKKMD